MKQYTITLTITEGNDEFWEESTASNKTGCDEVIQLVTDLLSENGLEPEIKLTKYTDL